MRNLHACGAVASLALTLAACSPFGSDSFQCETTEQCGAGGMCETSTHFCSFVDSNCPGGRSYGEYSGELAGQCTGEIPVIVDAPPDEPPPASCAANTKACYGNAIETCLPDGSGYDPAVRVPCALACDAAATGGVPTCYQASGIPVTDQIGCGGPGDQDLQAGAGATVTFKDNEISCQNCGGGVTSIPRRGTNPNTWFCVKSLSLGNGASVKWQTTSVVTVFVATAAVVDATIDLDGQNAQTVNAGGGGPGGGSGGGLSNDNSPGKSGMGPCAGMGGGNSGSGATSVGGGGGGAGGAGPGGDGGDGGNEASAGGKGGVTSTECDSITVQPLRGGSGGGGGGDGSCGPGVGCGAPGGGGGGGLQLVVRGTLTGGGAIHARGGDGADSLLNSPGGGGAGAGGNVLIEARSVMLTGALEVSGGNGGKALVRAGGVGGQLAGTDGTDGPGGGDGGGGGGAASGRIRVNALTAPNACSNAKPTAACAPGPLKVQGS